MFCITVLCWFQTGCPKFLPCLATANQDLYLHSWSWRNAGEALSTELLTKSTWFGYCPAAQSYPFGRASTYRVFGLFVSKVLESFCLWEVLQVMSAGCSVLKECAPEAHVLFFYSCKRHECSYVLWDSQGPLLVTFLTGKLRQAHPSVHFGASSVWLLSLEAMRSAWFQWELGALSV